MTRRALYQYGSLIPFDETGNVGLGLGTAISLGSITLIAPRRMPTPPSRSPERRWIGSSSGRARWTIRPSRARSPSSQTWRRSISSSRYSTSSVSGSTSSSRERRPRSRATSTRTFRRRRSSAARILTEARRPTAATAFRSSLAACARCAGRPGGSGRGGSAARLCGRRRPPKPCTRPGR